MRTAGRKHLLHDRAAVAQREPSGVRRDRGKQRPTFAVSHQHDAILAILVEKTRSNASKVFEVAAAQRLRERQHLKPACHALTLGIEHEADTADGFENALRRILAFLLVVVEDDAGRENNQRQRGRRDQKSKTYWQ